MLQFMTVVKICLSLHGRSKEIYRCLSISCAKTQQKLNVKYKNCLFVTEKGSFTSHAYIYEYVHMYIYIISLKNKFQNAILCSLYCCFYHLKGRRFMHWFFSLLKKSLFSSHCHLFWLLFTVYPWRWLQQCEEGIISKALLSLRLSKKGGNRENSHQCIIPKQGKILRIETQIA